MFLAFALGAAFIAVWFTEASNLWAKAELLWEGLYFLLYLHSFQSRLRCNTEWN